MLKIFTEMLIERVGLLATQKGRVKQVSLERCHDPVINGGSQENIQDFTCKPGRFQLESILFDCTAPNKGVLGSSRKSFSFSS